MVAAKSTLDRLYIKKLLISSILCLGPASMIYNTFNILAPTHNIIIIIIIHITQPLNLK